MVFFKSRMLEAVAPLLPKIYRHPFNVGLYKGSLPKEVFYKFLEQDKIYLREFSKALKKTATRLTTVQHQKLFYKLSENAFKTQDNLHHKYLFPSDSLQFFSSCKTKPVKIIPPVLAYTTYLHKTANDAPIHRSVASLMPCFIIYGWLGSSMRDVDEKHPYSLWIKSYSDKKFLFSGKAIIAVANALAPQLTSSQQVEMISSFLESTEYELAFWNKISENSEMPIKNELIFR